MKARFLALAALVLGLASCQTEPEGLDVNVGGEVDTVVTVSLPETTRANSALGAFDNVVASDDYTVRYIFQVFYNGEESQAKRQVIYSDGKTVSFPVRLVPGRHYNFVAWADVVPQGDKTLDQLGVYDPNSDYRYNTANLMNIQIDPEWDEMDETRDAFTGHFDTAVDGDKKPYNGTKSINFTLIRPFAKLRVITTDMEQLNDLTITPTKAKVVYTSDLYSSFNAVEGAVVTGGKIANKTHDIFEIKEYADNVDDKSMVLFTDYLFAADEAEPVNFILTVYDQNGVADENIIKTNNFNTAIPLQRNYLTTISGNVLTDGNNVTVEVEKDGAFAGETQWPDENKSAEQLAYAAMFGGEVTLTENVVLTQPLEIVNGANVVINLDGKTITGASVKGEGAIIENNGILTLVGGTIKNTETNGDAVINNNGELVLDGVKIEGAPLGDGGYSAYAVISSGKMTINDGTEVYADRGCLKLSNGGETFINGGLFVNNDIGTRSLTSHVVDVEDGGNNNLTINGGTFEHRHTNTSGGVVICNRTKGTVYVNGGKFSGGKYVSGQYNLSDYGYGGKFSVKGGIFSDNISSKYIAAGYKAIVAGGLYYVLPEIIANAAETAGVTAVTESPADVATALATNNGEAALFMWNDVAYIAKYGKVIITSAADEATTVRGVVEYSTGLTSATVADGIEVVGNRTFRKCANLETVALPNTLTEIGPGVFQSCSKLANITIPESVTTIGEGAFAECSSLESINIPAGVTRIEADALRATGLVSVEFHEGVTYFGTQAFRDCKQLKEVIIKAPVFTVEANAFGVMAGTLPGTKIYVANAEMKAYLESTLAYKNQFQVIAPNVVNSTDALNNALKDGAKIVTVSAGEYTFPSSVAKGVTINCAEGTVFTGTSDLNINGATVIGAEFKNENGTAVSGTIYGNFKNCTFTGSEALRWCYSGAGKTTVFENCVIKTDFRGFHYDGMNGDVIFRNCEINGFNAYGGEGTATFEGCTFGCDESRYNGLNIYSNTNLINCTFNFVSGKTNFIDMEGTGKTLKITNCKATLDGVDANIDGFVGGSKLAENTVIYE